MNIWGKLCAGGAVFDLDGTLIDSMEIWREIDAEFFARRGMPVPEGYQDAIAHLGFRDVAAYTVQKYLPRERADDLIAEWNAMCLRKYAAADAEKYFKSGAIAFLRKLHEQGVRMAVATASSPELFVPILRAGGVYDLFECFYTVDDAGKNKSFPDIFLLCADKLALPPERCVVFEDNLLPVLAAKRAGMVTVAVYDASSENQRETLEREADLYIEGFEELL